jgi:transcriptional regulator with XRE-family HTH domain
MDKFFINRRIAMIRVAKGISARQLSFELDQASEYINQIENCRSMPSIEGLLKFCDYFGITLGEFFEQEVTYLMEYKELFGELNKLDKLELQQIMDLVKLINRKK